MLSAKAFNDERNRPNVGGDDAAFCRRERRELTQPRVIVAEMVSSKQSSSAGYESMYASAACVTTQRMYLRAEKQ